MVTVNAQMCQEKKKGSETLKLPIGGFVKKKKIL